MIRITDVINAPIPATVEFVRMYLPPGHHSVMKKSQLWLLALQILDDQGMLTPDDSSLLNTPLFGEAFVAEGGDIEATLARISFDMLPGVGLFRVAALFVPGD